ncbi:MAG: hypothetical protein NTZ35_03605 [Ignavibacteriales bacterium]|nr:hypothetical protein [Ignavibacteriales bacterium]
MLRSQIIVVLFCSFFVFFIAGCAETPNQVGAKLLPGKDLLRVDTTTVWAIASTSQPVIIGTASSPRLLLGKVNTIESWGLIQFASLPDSIRLLPFVSAQLNLRTIYHFGDSLAPFSVAIHNVLMNWSSDSLTMDSLKAPGFYESNPRGIGSFSSVGDTVTISIPLDTAMIRTWGTSSDTLSTNFGLLLRPTNSNVVKGFGTFSQSDAALWPQLLLLFQGSGGVIDSLMVNTGSDRFVATGPAPSWRSDSTHIYVQNGFAYRGAIDFDVSVLPPHAAIHKATLQLTSDPSRTQFNYFTVDSLRAYFVDTSGVAITYLESISEGAQIGTAKVYQITVGSFMQRWVAGTGKRRLIIAGFEEWSALDLFSLYGAGASKTLKPKLTIYYSLIQ